MTTTPSKKVIHDLSNIATLLMLNAELLSERVAESKDEQVRTYAARLKAGSEQLMEAVKKMRLQLQ